MAGLNIKNLSKAYCVDGKQFFALKDISLEVPDKSFTTIVGKSGCGKTTLLRILCGLENETSGSFEITNCKDCSKKIAIVFQEPRLMPWLTIEQNMALPLINCKDKIYVKQTVEHNLNLLGLNRFKKAYPSQISGGMAQRTALGRTLCYDPEIILMDEPLGALDAFTRKKLQKELINIYLEFKKTIIFVTHDIDEAIYLGQDIILMNSGSIVEKATIDLDYLRDVQNPKFIYYKEQILNICNKIWEEKDEII